MCNKYQSSLNLINSDCKHLAYISVSLFLPTHTHSLSCTKVLGNKVTPKHLEALAVIKLYWFLFKIFIILNIIPCTYGPLLSRSSTFITVEIQASLSKLETHAWIPPPEV